MNIILKKIMQAIMKVIGHTIVGIVILVIIIFEITTRDYKENTFTKKLEDDGYSKIELSKPLVEILMTSRCGKFQRYSFKAINKDGKKSSGIICETMTGVHLELDKNTNK